VSGAPAQWTVAAWAAFPGLAHAFFGRRGGVSRGPFASLNCSDRLGDEAEAVRENRARAARGLGAERIALPRQVHGDRISHDLTESEEADGLVVRATGVAAGVLTADCVPLLMVLPDARVAAAVHAGWKGTALGIAVRAAQVLCAETGLPPAELHVALGPAIGSCCYEVGVEVIDALESGAARGCVRLEKRSAERGHVDLRRINAAQLRQLGVRGERIHRVGPCTACARDELYSHRASRGAAGRQLSAIAWR